MAIFTRKPVNSSLRAQKFIKAEGLSDSPSEKSLLRPLHRTGGRNAYGRITVRHRGGGAKKHYRIIDFKRNPKDIPGKVTAFDYDPNRNVSIALLVYQNGEKSYILRPEEIVIGSVLLSGKTAEARPGNCLPLRNIPTGFFIHNIELVPGRGGQMVRAAGGAAQLVGKEGEKAILRLPSSEMRTVNIDNWATVGRLSSSDYSNLVLGKAGRSRHRGIRPSVRGMAMNPIDHPHGGGEGRSKSGSHPTTPWGKCCKGARTRKRKHPSLIRRRKSRK